MHKAAGGSNHIYHFSVKETQAPKKGFFFAEKMSCKLCAAYHQYLDQVAMIFCYPSPLLLSALEQLREAKIFTKFGLCRKYILVHVWEDVMHILCN